VWPYFSSVSSGSISKPEHFLIDCCSHLFLIGCGFGQAIEHNFGKKLPPSFGAPGYHLGANDRGSGVIASRVGLTDLHGGGFYRSNPQKRHRDALMASNSGDHHHLRSGKLTEFKRCIYLNRTRCNDCLKIICDQLSLGMKLFVPRSVEAIASGVNLDAVSSAYS
jgi:hypothetical protein